MQSIKKYRLISAALNKDFDQIPAVYYHTIENKNWYWGRTAKGLSKGLEIPTIPIRLDSKRPRKPEDPRNSDKECYQDFIFINEDKAASEFREFCINHPQISYIASDGFTELNKFRKGQAFFKFIDLNEEQATKINKKKLTLQKHSFINTMYNDKNAKALCDIMFYNGDNPNGMSLEDIFLKLWEVADKNPQAINENFADEDQILHLRIEKAKTLFLVGTQKPILITDPISHSFYFNGREERLYSSIDNVKEDLKLSTNLMEWFVGHVDAAEDSFISVNEKTLKTSDKSEVGLLSDSKKHDAKMEFAHTQPKRTLGEIVDLIKSKLTEDVINAHHNSPQIKEFKNFAMTLRHECNWYLDVDGFNKCFCEAIESTTGKLNRKFLLEGMSIAEM